MQGALGLQVIFIFWLALYRYPVFEVLYPSVRTRALESNSRIYTPLRNQREIRIVCLKPGNKDDAIKYELITGPLASMDFEALSYVWGVSIFFHTIQVDHRPFSITYNLEQALRGLRLPDRERLLWIDALSINQYDNAEKGSQVHMMRDIFAHASKTRVWLGLVTNGTHATFEFLTRFEKMCCAERHDFWRNSHRMPDSEAVVQEIFDMLYHEWWRRVWVIQEVVVSKSVFIQCGAHEVSWDTLHNFLSEFSDTSIHSSVDFANAVQLLRKRATAPTSLLNLVYTFRLQSASFGSDKTYALQGLLPSNHSSLLRPDYGAAPEDIFVRFTVSSIMRDNDLTVLALAAGVEGRGVTWCRDWRTQWDGLYAFSCFSTHAPPGRDYHASGTHSPVCAAGIHSRVLSLQGYQADTIVRTSGLGHPSREVNFLLQDWESVADIRSKERNESFNRTITADCWLDLPLDWHHQINLGGKGPSTNGVSRDYKNLILHACSGRKFFVTAKGRFGLAHWKIRQGDAVCVLLGGKTPFILRQCSARGRRQTMDGAAGQNYYNLVSEAFVDGLMYYEGSMEEDIGSGKVVPEWFHLL
jgi:hypothetical protein